MINLKLFGFSDPSTRENFAEIVREFRDSPILKGTWKFIEKEFGDVGTYKVYHGLGFIPKDVIVTASVGTGSAAFSFEEFTKEYCVIQVASVPLKIRFLVGKVQ